MAQHGYLSDDYRSGYDPDHEGDPERRESGLRGRRFMLEHESGRGRLGDADEWFGGRDTRDENRSRFRSRLDDHYLSWRAKQIADLDRDYDEYCREREQQFHQDFDSWRTARRSRSGERQETPPEQTSSEAMILDTPVAAAGEVAGAVTSPLETATLGQQCGEYCDGGGNDRARTALARSAAEPHAARSVSPR